MSENPQWWDTRALIPDYRDIMVGERGWKPKAAAYREQHPPRELRYGQGERHTLDLFDTGTDLPPLLFIHGGFWHAPLNKSFFSHLATGPNALGIPVGVMSYDLCPEVSIDEILEQTVKAARLLIERFGEIVVSGHSAGGHAVAHLLSQPGVKAGYAISAVSDLRTLIHAPFNTALKLDAAAAQRLSPLFWEPPKGKTLDAVVGALEHEGFREQTARLAQAWEQQGVLIRTSEIPGSHHLSVIDGLADPNSPMSQRILEMVETK